MYIIERRPTPSTPLSDDAKRRAAKYAVGGEPNIHFFLRLSSFFFFFIIFLIYLLYSYSYIFIIVYKIIQIESYEYSTQHAPAHRTRAEDGDIRIKKKNYARLRDFISIPTVSELRRTKDKGQRTKDLFAFYSFCAPVYRLCALKALSLKFNTPTHCGICRDVNRDNL